MKTLIVVAMLLVLIVIGYLLLTFNKTPVASQEIAGKNQTNPTALVETNLGSFVIELYQNDAPLTVNNFVKLVNQDFYSNLTFHRVVKNFVIQGGDPKGDGTGGPGYTFADELDSKTASYQAGYIKGIVAMANAGPNTNGSQWFVTLADAPLPHNYTIFGKVVTGQEVVDKIGLVPVDSHDKPLSPVVIKKITIKN